MCMNLRVPRYLGDGEGVERGDAYVLLASPAVVGELLQVDDNLLEDIALCNTFHIFLRAVFEPPVIGDGKFAIEERNEGIVFLRKEVWRDDYFAHGTAPVKTSNVKGLPCFYGVLLERGTGVRLNDDRKEHINCGSVVCAREEIAPRIRAWRWLEG